MFLLHCRRLCWRSDRVAVCVHQLPPALPTLSAHGLPPTLRQPGCRRSPALTSAGWLAAHWQCHHPSPGGFDWRASMTSGHHRDPPQHPHQTTEPTSRFPVTDWLLCTFKGTVTHLTHLRTDPPHLVSVTPTSFCVCVFLYIYIWILLSSRESLYLMWCMTGTCEYGMSLPWEGKRVENLVLKESESLLKVVCLFFMRGGLNEGQQDSVLDTWRQGASAGRTTMTWMTIGTTVGCLWSCF